jgi:hypothetical protein
MKEQTFILSKGIRSLTRLFACLSALPTDIDVKVTIAEAKKERSNPQNNALYGVAYKTLGDFCGYTAPELHDAMLRAYFGEVTKEVLGQVSKVPRRTTTTDENGKRSLLTTREFCDFYSFIQQKGAEIGCWVPDPDPMWFMQREHQADAA